MTNHPDYPNPDGLIIAIDGPAASGKGTLARRLAAEFDLPHLDTGLTYRAVALAVVNSNRSLDDEEYIVEIAQNIDLSNLDRDVLSDHKIGEAASKIAVISDVRSALVEAQRKFANQPPGAVLDGRDIGTKVCPDATLKLFVTASVEKRARRRYDELTAKGKRVARDEILADLAVRDARDTNRQDSPLRPAEDAHLIDTSEMDIETAFQVAMGLVKQAMAAKNRD